MIQVLRAVSLRTEACPLICFGSGNRARQASTNRNTRDFFTSAVYARCYHRLVRVEGQRTSIYDSEPGDKMVRLLRLLLCLSLLGADAFAQWEAKDPVTTVERQKDGIEFATRSGAHFRLQVLSAGLLHASYSPNGRFAPQPEYVVLPQQWPAVPWQSNDDGKQITLTTARVRATVDRSNGAVAYADAQGTALTSDSKRLMYPTVVNGEHTYRGEMVVAMYGSHEALYGLGQHQAGVWNYRGESVDLSQENTNIAVPLLLSTNGYGIFWNNASRTRFNNRFVHSLYVSSEVADTLDYYFLYGPSFDAIIAAYRQLTGAAPMYARWAYGFWQSKNRYRSQRELLDVAAGYRSRQIPIDNIVQDWFWWKLKGQHQFNENYPDPRGMVEALHRRNLHLMISVWPFFEPGSKEYAAMDQHGWFVDRTKFENPPYHHDRMAVYDATSPEARKYYWSLMNQGLFRLGVDAWWLDTTEPETEGQEENILLGHKLAIGSGDRYVNLYPLMTTAAVYEGQRAASDQKRVFILSRSAFAGAQRNAVTAWSGDILEDWLSFKRQIPAGLNYSLSGMPYWTTDIGGFTSGGNVNDASYRELFIRWFEYGAFCPIFRTHGTRTPDTNELWSYGANAERILRQYDRLRYRLMPYHYALAWKTTSESYTPMRPLVMDYREDVQAQNTGDEFLYGPALLVAPVTEPAAATREVYLPRGKWYDFWSGTVIEGGRRLQAQAPLDRMPLFVPAGAILPLGPDEQYASEKTDPIELRVYRGASGSFTLYEDENDNYHYEKGAHAAIALQWDESAHTLTIGARSGSYPGMPARHTFRVVFVDASKGSGIEATADAQAVDYSGQAVTVRAR